jgi:hypothetical protein
MPIKKQDFYEGAALSLIARTGAIGSIGYSAPFFLLNNRVSILLKYSTKGRSPWGFTFTPEEQAAIQKEAKRSAVILGMVCGHDGVAAIPSESYSQIATLKTSSIHLSCYRQHGEHYEINGPDGVLKRKIAPSQWLRILD